MKNKALQWTLFNFGFVTLFIWGYTEPNDGILTLSLAMFWVSAVTGLFGFSADFAKKVYEDKPDYKFSVPQGIDNAFDAVVTLMLAYTGFTVLSVVYLIHIFGLNTLRENLDKLQSGSNNQTENIN